MKLRKILSLLISVMTVMSVMTGFCVFAQTGEIYVSPVGDDNANGTIDEPLKTLHAARDKAREYNSAVTIYLREGEYPLSETLVLDERDSGKNAENIVTWKAYNDEEVCLQGGKNIDVSKATAITDEVVYNRLSEGVRDKVVQIDLTKQGIDNFGVIEQYGMGVGNHPEAYPKYKDRTPVQPPVLFADGELLTLARYPNGNEWLITGKIYNTGSVPRNWLDDHIGKDGYVPPEERENPAIGPTFGYDDERISTWVNEKNGWISGMWYYDWAQCTLKIDSIDTEKKRIISTSTPSPYGIRKNQRYYAFNILEELDTAGEYYIDREKGMLYVYLPETKPKKLSIATDDEFTIIKAENLENVLFESIVFEITKDTAFYGDNLNNVKFENCEFRKCGEYGAEITNSNNVGFNNCYIHSMNKSGISIFGGGDMENLISSGNYITNCYSHSIGIVEKTFSYPFINSSVGMYIANNEAHDLPFGVATIYTNCTIENNQFYDAVKETDDCGVIGAGRSYIEGRGAKLNNNLIYDVNGMGASGGTGVRAFMFDDTLSGVEVTNNIVYDAVCGMSINGGRDNIVKNNIFYNTGYHNFPIIAVNDLSSREASAYYTQLQELENKTFWKNDVWKEAFPKLYTILDNGEEYKKPSGNLITQNFMLNSNGISYHEGFPKISTLSGNYEGDVDTTFFRNVDKRDFSISDEDYSKELLKNFETIDVSKIGTTQRQLIRDSLTMKPGSNAAFIGNSAQYIDSDNHAVMPVIVNGRTMVPVRFIAEAFGAEVSWNEAEKKVGIVSDGREVSLVIGSKQIIVNGEEKETDEPAFIENNRTLVPLRAIAEGLGKEVFWNDNGLIIISENGADMESKIDNRTAKQILRFFDNPYITPPSSEIMKASTKFTGHMNDSDNPENEMKTQATEIEMEAPSKDAPKGESSVKGKELVKSWSFEEEPYGFVANLGKTTSDFVTDEFAREGKKSAKIGLEKFYLSNEYASEENLIATVWIYDYADSEIDSRFLVNVSENEYQSPHQAIGINTDVSRDCYVWTHGDVHTASTVKRTKGWHEFKFDYSNGKDMLLYVDGILIGTIKDGTYVNMIAMLDLWEDKHYSKIYIDDISIWK